MGCHRAVIALLILAWAGIFAPDGSAADRGRPYREGELLVQFKSGLRAAAGAGLARDARVRTSRAIGGGGIQHVVLEPGVSVDQALAVYAQSPDVAFAEPNYLLRPQALPADTYFDQQWGLVNGGQVVGGYTGTPGADMDAAAAWDISTGSSEVIVAVLDTGCDLNHPDLAANIWTNPGEIPGNGIDDDGNHFIDDVHGWDFSDQDNDPQDGSGHGTHVAGIIGAAGANARGIAGVAWQVRIMPLRFMNALEEGSVADAIDAIEYALSMGVKIINCSWGSTGYSTSLRYVMANADALFICAAGNTSTDTDMAPFYPASFGENNIIAVTASDQMDRLASFSNYGTVSVDVAAPGIRIFSLTNGRRTLWSENFDGGWPVGWTSGGPGDTWTVADPPAMAGQPALAVSSPANYLNNANAWAQTPALDLSTASSSQVTFRLIGQSEADADYLRPEVSADGSAWYALPLQMGGTIKYSGISGSVNYWMTAKADLGPWDGQPQLFMRLRFQSDSDDTGTGFYIDDMQLSVSDAVDGYRFMQGTSMAAGYVSGLAALVLSAHGALSPPELKAVIEDSVDLNQNLLEKVAAGGRVNAFNALTLLRELYLTAAPAAANRIRLTWTAQSPLNAHVLIERRTDDQAGFEIVAQVDADTNSFVDDSVAANATYYYRVQAETHDGRSGYSNQTLATTAGTPGTSSAAADGGSSGGGGCFLEALVR